MKYIDAEKLIKSVNNYQEGAKAALNPIDGNADYYKGKIDACEDMRWFIASHQQEQPDFPTTDEQVKEFLATHPKIKVPEKYKNPDWLFKKQEQPEENKLPNKRTRINYAICKLQSFKPIREAIVLDDYVYDEGKCYRENLLNYIHAIPENRLTEIRSYLKENGQWPYDDDADWMKHEQPEVELKKEIITQWSKCNPTDEGMGSEYAIITVEQFDAIARHFYELGLNARKEE